MLLRLRQVSWELPPLRNVSPTDQRRLLHFMVDVHIEATIPDEILSSKHVHRLHLSPCTQGIISLSFHGDHVCTATRQIYIPVFFYASLVEG